MHFHRWKISEYSEISEKMLNKLSFIQKDGYIYVNFCLENKKHLVFFAVNISIYYKAEYVIQSAKREGTIRHY